LRKREKHVHCINGVIMTACVSVFVLVICVLLRKGVMMPKFVN